MSRNRRFTLSLLLASFANPLNSFAEAVICTENPNYVCIPTKIWQANIEVQSGHKQFNITAPFLDSSYWEITYDGIAEVHAPPGYTLCGAAATNITLNGGGGGWGFLYKVRPDGVPVYDITVRAHTGAFDVGGTSKVSMLIFAVQDSAFVKAPGAPSKPDQNATGFDWTTDATNNLKVACPLNSGSNIDGQWTKQGGLQVNDAFWSSNALYVDPTRPPGCPIGRPGDARCNVGKAPLP